MPSKYLIFIGLIALAGRASAQDENAANANAGGSADEWRESSITVLANGVREPLVTSGKSITTFDRADIEAVQGADLGRLLERAPGVSLSRNGGPGNFTAVRVRGGEGEQLLVVVDGARLADTAAPGAGFDFGNLLMGNLAKVELQRSANSTIWGSQALAGVLLASTDSASGISASGEYGADDTAYLTARAGLAIGPAAINLNAGHFRTDGFSAAAVGTEPDGFRQTELGGRAELDLGRGLAAYATGRWADGRLDLDGFPAPSFVLADTDEYQETRQRSGALGLRYAGTGLELNASASLADTERDSFDPALGPAPGYTTDGTSERVELRGRWQAARLWALDFGAEREWTRFSTLFDPTRRTAISGGYAQLGYSTSQLHLAAGVRRDEHRDFGGKWSLGADAALDLGAVRLTMSYGEGFKAPSLFQLLSDYGNVALQPERSRSYDVGAGVNTGPLHLKLTAFRRDTRGQIGFVSCFGVTGGICTNRPFGTYENTGRVRAYGLETEASLELGHDVKIGAVYTLLDTEDRTPGAATRGNDLARRPGDALTAIVDWQPSRRTRIGADLRVVSASFDDAANLVRLPGYEVATVRGEWDSSDHVTLFGRIENVLNARYQTAAGYATPARGGYIGARVRL